MTAQMENFVVIEPSALAKDLILELHEPMKNEERWPIADKFLIEAWREGFKAGQITQAKGWDLPKTPDTLEEPLAVPQGDGAYL